ncbi:hypothetical protein HDV05_006398 [Chytridiales sp. JEL 0842]|nr:hypothetical protein HDV05_006398 [Chytridiales sp. JEL 0842]
MSTIFQGKATKVTLEGKVAVVTLNRPKAMNTFNADMNLETIEIFKMLDVDNRVRAIVVTGAGDHFCAGADLTVGDFSSEGMFGPTDEPPALQLNNHRDGGGRSVLAIHNCRKPVIGAINGTAVGVGATITLGMDIRIACKQARIGFVFVRRGITPEACSGYFLPRLVGYSRAMELFLTGRVYPADSPALGNLFSTVYDTREEVLPAAMKLAHDIAENTSSISAAMTKALVWRGGDSAEAQHLIDSKSIFALGAGPDGKEGVKSFMEKRKPAFTGSSNELPHFYPWWKAPSLETLPYKVTPKSKL